MVISDFNTFSYSFLILAAAVLLVAGIFYLVLRRQRAERNAMLEASRSPLEGLNKLHDRKSKMSLRDPDREIVPEKKYRRKMSAKRYKVRKRMFNASRKRCRGKK